MRMEMIQVTRDISWSSLHHQEISLVTWIISILMDRHLEFIGRVKGDLTNLLILSSVGNYTTMGKLSTLKNGSLRSITIDFSLKNGLTVLSRLEFSTVTQHGNSLQRSPSSSTLVKSLARLVLRSICFMNLVVKPHVSHSHSVLGQSTSFV